jgi:hypothetical protein
MLAFTFRAIYLLRHVGLSKPSQTYFWLAGHHRPTVIGASDFDIHLRWPEVDAISTDQICIRTCFPRIHTTRVLNLLQRLYGTPHVFPHETLTFLLSLTLVIKLLNEYSETPSHWG